MNFLAIDTSGEHMTVIAYRNGKRAVRFLPACARAHSVKLMDEICGALGEAGLTPSACDFFAAVVGPGSFTGIRIGVACVKGLCLATDKPALSVTSFDVLAYHERGSVLAQIDAGHGYLYACGYNDRHEIVFAPAFLTQEEARATGLRAVTPADCDLVEGLTQCVLEKSGCAADASRLTALYLRKSSAEVNLR